MGIRVNKTAIAFILAILVVSIAPSASYSLGNGYEHGGTWSESDFCTQLPSDLRSSVTSIIFSLEPIFNSFMNRSHRLPTRSEAEALVGQAARQSGVGDTRAIDWTINELFQHLPGGSCLKQGDGQGNVPQDPNNPVGSGPTGNGANTPVPPPGIVNTRLSLNFQPRGQVGNLASGSVLNLLGNSDSTATDFFSQAEAFLIVSGAKVKDLDGNTVSPAYVGEAGQLTVQGRLISPDFWEQNDRGDELPTIRATEVVLTVAGPSYTRKACTLYHRALVKTAKAARASSSKGRTHGVRANLLGKKARVRTCTSSAGQK